MDLLECLWWSSTLIIYISVSGAVAYSNAYFGRGSGPYHLDNVYCSGSESSLLSCSRGNSIGIHNCEPGNDAGVKCSKCVVPMCIYTLHY